MSARKSKKLRSGFTTGAAAAAAAKGALLSLLAQKTIEKVQITFLTGTQTEIKLHQIEVTSSTCAQGIVIKDAGDDPDVTHKAKVGATIKLVPYSQGSRVIISGGQGVGMVTKPGLEIPPGQAAINPGPLRMITNEVSEVLDQFSRQEGVQVVVFVPNGEELAKKTLNARLGIVGGLSILGTTGVERPMSHSAYLATIEKALAVAKACGLNQAILTTGRRSERFIQMHWPQQPEEAFIQIGDFFKASLEMAAKQNFSKITLSIFFGKAVKMALGTPHTHAAKSNLTLEHLAHWTAGQGGDKVIATKIRQANTARHAYELLKENHPHMFKFVALKVCAWAQRFAGSKVGIRVILLDYEGSILVDHSGCGYEKREYKE